MTSQIFFPFPSAFSPSPPLTYARLSANGAENLPLRTEPPLEARARLNAFICAVGANGVGGPGAPFAARREAVRRGKAGK